MGRHPGHDAIDDRASEDAQKLKLQRPLRMGGTGSSPAASKRIPMHQQRERRPCVEAKSEPMTADSCARSQGPLAARNRRRSITAHSANNRFAPIVLKNSKIAVLRKSRKCSALAISAAAGHGRIDTSASDRFCGNSCGPSHRSERNAPAVLRIFSHERKRTFSTQSANSGRSMNMMRRVGPERAFAAGLAPAGACLLPSLCRSSDFACDRNLLVDPHYHGRNP
jgi:hypothetical protein